MAANPPGTEAPSTAAIAIATAILSGITGYFIGQGRSIGLLGGSSNSRSNKATRQFHPEARHDSGSDISDASSDTGDENADLSSFPGDREECKLVLVVRTDLGMGKGKTGK